jgi:hypothetical protein
VSAPVPAAQDDASTSEMEAMMAKMAALTQPGEHHAALERFLGTWDVELRFFMGGQATPATKGKAEYTWLMDGRWIQGKVEGTMMNMPYEAVSTMGYDNFKQSYVVSSVSSMDTAMHYAEGDLTRDGDALIVYGTLDEYLDGQHDKMVKTVFRFRSADAFAMEVHDLPIGETNTKVVEFSFKRAKR